MRTLTLVVVVSALFGCAGSGASTGTDVTSLTQEQLDGTQWLYNPELTDSPIPADDLVGSQDGFQLVDLQRYGNQVVAYEQGGTGQVLGVWRDGEVEQGGQDQVITPGTDQHSGALVSDVNLGRQTTGRGNFGPDTRGANDGFGIDRFGDDLRRTLQQSDFYIFHPGCI
jgi:hypothetical protein